MQNFGLYHIKQTMPWKINKIPKGFNEIYNPLLSSTMSCYNNISRALIVVSSEEIMDNDKSYIHISLSHKNKIPDWETVKYVKENFIGEDKDAFIYFPVKSEYVNFMPYCLHLWSELDNGSDR